MNLNYKIYQKRIENNKLAIDVHSHSDDWIARMIDTDSLQEISGLFKQAVNIHLT